MSQQAEGLIVGNAEKNFAAFPTPTAGADFQFLAQRPLTLR
jgi:hypothetical protein